MVRKFTRPPPTKSVMPDSTSMPAASASASSSPGGTAAAASSSPSKETNAKKDQSPTASPTPPRKRSSPKPKAKSSVPAAIARTTTSSAPLFSGPRSEKRVRQPVRPYQAPEDIPLKILQLIKSDEEISSSNPKPSTSAAAAAKAKAPAAAQKRAATPETKSSVSPKRKKSSDEKAPKAKATPKAKKSPTTATAAAASKEKPTAAKKRKQPSTATADKIDTSTKKTVKAKTKAAKVLVKKARVSIKNTTKTKPSSTAAAAASVVKKAKKPKVSTLNGVPIPTGDSASAGISATATATATAIRLQPGADKPKIKKPRKKKLPPDSLGLGQGPFPGPSSSAMAATAAASGGPTPPKKRKKEKIRKDLPYLSLTRRENVTNYEKDPTFDSNLPIPFISTVAQSKLLIRATRTGNIKLLEKLLKEKKEITSVRIPQSLTNAGKDAAYYAVETENLEALKMLMNSKLCENLGPFPDSMMDQESSGKGSYMQFGHGMRAVTVARGGKEGNNALTKDTSNQTHKSGPPSLDELVRHALALGKPYAFLTKIMALDKDRDVSHWMFDNITSVFLSGHYKLGGELVAEAIKRGGFGFNELHKEALTLSNKVPFSPFKSVSVVKKAQGNARVTPIHLAAINPDLYYLATLLGSKPDFSILDTVHRTPMHYAAVCVGTGPLDFLLSRGISPEVLDKEGKSPLYMAAEAGRAANVEKILRAIKGSGKPGATAEAKEIPEDISGPFIDRPCRTTGLSPIHIAAEKGHDAVVRTLLNLGASAEKTTPATKDKLTPLMIAAQYGHLAVVKVLIEEGGVKVDVKDKRGRTALAHAVIDGNAHIVSYLLRLGADNKVKDTSGNTLVHYAAAYGWYYNWQLLLESGCPPNEQNDWKMTPVAIAFMKGHIGLVELALSQPQGADSTGPKVGVDINAPVNYANGMTLLHQTCANPGELIVTRLKFLIESQGADVSVLDYERNNALHYLVQSEKKRVDRRSQGVQDWWGDERKAEWAAETKKMQESIFAAARMLLRHNCDTQAVNLKGETPVSLAARLGCFDLLKVFLASGKCDKLSAPEVEDSKKQATSTILHHLIGQTRNRGTGAVEFYKYCMTQPKLIEELKPMARKLDEKGDTPLLSFLRHLDDRVSDKRFDGEESVGTKSESDQDEDNEDGQSGENSGDEDGPRKNRGKPPRGRPDEEEEKKQNALGSVKPEELATDLLKFLVNILNSDVNQVVEDKKDKNSALHILALTKRCGFADKLAEILLSKKPGLETLNGDSRTPLLVAVSNRNESVARVLLNAGANPNFQSTKDEGKSILIIAAETAKESFSLVQLLVEKGANVRELSPKTGNSVLHLVASQPGMSGALEAMRKITATGKFPPTSMNKLGRTPLHLAVNARGGETDVSYDVEDLLIEVGSKALTIADVRGRLPLHYAFVKVGKYKDSSFIDPIELVAILTRAMKDSHVWEKIHAGDEFMGTPLHYAAQRGATISSSLLISEARGDKSKINPVDANGNTPYGLAVLKGHEGCALYFQQSGGDFMSSLNSKFKGEPEPSPKPWRWQHSVLVDEYEERKLQERSKYPILQEVVRKDWQGLLHLMLEKLKNSGAGVTPAIEVAIKTNRLKLALKLVNRVKNNRELSLTREQQSLLHTLAKTTEAMNMEFSSQLVQSLVLKGIGVQSIDSVRATPFIYAAVNLNADLCAEFGKYAKLAEIGTLIADKLGRTPFSALFWNITKDSKLSPALKTWAEQLLANGSKANILCHYPIALSNFPVTRSLTTKESTYSCKLSPLITAVVQGNYDTVKWLLSLNKAGKPMVVDPNYPDELGRTPLIHAARLNDVKMVRLLLNSKTYDPDKDTKPWVSKGKVGKINIPDPTIDLKIQDRNGWTVIHHLVAPVHPINIFYFNSDIILRLLASIGAPLETKSTAKQTPLSLARQLKFYKLATVLQTLLGIHDYSTTSNDEQDNSSAATVDGDAKSGTTTVETIDFGADAAKMAEKLTNDAKVDGPDAAAAEDGPTSWCEPDPLSGMTKENSVVIFDETLQIPYDCLLTQVDLSYGVYGLYNFYKMQVIKEKHGKEMIILFTRWGRVGDEGQFQKTPFPTAEEATREFRKIFRAKSGNSWELVKAFTPIPKKYRLVHVDRSSSEADKSKKNPVKVDFMELEVMAVCTGSNISPSVFELIKILCLTHRRKQKDTFDDGDSGGLELPFGSLSADTLKKGDKILDEISKLLIAKETARKKLGSGAASASGSEQEIQFAEIMNSIIEKSEEFYGLIPVYGFEFEKLSPLFTWDLLRPKQEKIHSLVHLGFASKLLLASQLRMKEQNPFDYIYKSLGTKLELVEQNSEEAQLILQYIEDTSDVGRRHSDAPKIQGIYKVQRPGEIEQMKNLGIGNKWLLWHGTKTKNLLSILHNGLQAVPLGAELCGHMFGKGIYFADTFAKSRGYCGPGDNKDYPQNFMFLCEVALGNVQNVDFDDITDEQSALKSSFDSLKTCNARMIPDPGSVIYWKGGIVPLGKRIENIPEKEDEYFCLENNEYIIFNNNQVRLRYLVQF